MYTTSSQIQQTAELYRKTEERIQALSKEIAELRTAFREQTTKLSECERVRDDLRARCTALEQSQNEAIDCEPQVLAAAFKTLTIEHFRALCREARNG